MTKYYVHHKDSKILGYYNDEIHTDIPNNVTEITKEQLDNAVSINAGIFKKGKFLVTPLERTKAEQIRQKEYLLKKEIQSQVVVVDGYRINGDIDSQNKMMKVLLVLDTNENVIWTLTNKDKVKLNKKQIKLALKLALMKTTRFI